MNPNITTQPMKPPNQIAAELDHALIEFSRKKYPVLSQRDRKKTRIAIIQSVIDEATKELAQELNLTTTQLATERAAHAKRCSQCGMDSSVGHHKNCKAAAHASEPWTANYVAKLYAFADGNKSSQHVAAMARTFVTGWQAIADAHNSNKGPAHASEPVKAPWGQYSNAELDAISHASEQL